MLFLDDARMKNFTSAYKDVDFLNFFYKHLRENETGRFEEHFPYLSRCGRERNLLRCDDRPIVFTKILDDGKFWRLGESTIKVEIAPSRFFMLPNGRLYHPAPFGRYGLVKSAVADLIFPNFEFDSDGFPRASRCPTLPRGVSSSHNRYSYL
ncbi:unnamed protein product, partial [Mesorhabditis spiculigera]